MQSQQSGGKERRAVPRFTCEVQTTCQPPSAWGKDPWPAVIRDISTGGLSLRLTRRFERGSGLAIALPNDEGGTSTVLARVMNIEGHGNAWLLGCKFISELSEDEVRSIVNLDPLHQAVVDDPKGGNSTRTIAGVLFQGRVNGNDTVRWFVRRLDLGAAWPLPAGTTVSFRVASATVPPVEMVIQNSQRIGSYWIVNCAFPGRVSEAALLALAGQPA